MKNFMVIIDHRAVLTPPGTDGMPGPIPLPECDLELSWIADRDGITFTCPEHPGARAFVVNELIAPARIPNWLRRLLAL